MHSFYTNVTLMSKIFNIEQVKIYDSICGVTEKKKRKKNGSGK